MSVINLSTLFYKLLEAKLMTGLCIQAVCRWHKTLSVNGLKWYIIRTFWPWLGNTNNKCRFLLLLIQGTKSTWLFSSNKNKSILVYVLLKRAHVTGCSGLVHWDDPEGWGGEGVGRGFRMGNTCTPMVDSSQCMAKPIQSCKVKQINKYF